MADAPPLLSRAEVAARLHISERSLRRLLPTVPGLSPIRAGRTMLFDDRDLDRIQQRVEAIAGREPEARDPLVKEKRQTGKWPEVPAGHIAVHPVDLRPEYQIALSARDYLTCGIYFLLIGTRVVYVGISRNVFARIEEHKRAGRDFERWHYDLCDYERAVTLEAAYIAKLLPAWNVRGIPRV